MLNDFPFVDACCEAWNVLVSEKGRIASLCNYSWITKVAS
jgi:hypothetical protein